MNGAFQFTSDRPFNAADPSTYPERLTIRVPEKVEVLSRTHSLGLYAQDKWQINPQLTVNLGLRYDVHVSPVRWDYNPLFSDPNAYPIDKNNVAPRAGFAYNMGGRAVLRGGYGLFFEKQYIDRFQIYQLNPVFSNSFLAQYPGRSGGSRAEPGTAANRSVAGQRTGAEPHAGQPARSARSWRETPARSGWTTPIGTFPMRIRRRLATSVSSARSCRPRSTTRTCGIAICPSGST